MPCDKWITPDGSVATIVCSRGRRAPKPCAFCGRTASLLCDGPARVTEINKPRRELQSRTCDKPICSRCAWSPERGKDYCPACTPEEQARRAAEAHR